jgi:DNA polymerase III delta subunit
LLIDSNGLDLSRLHNEVQKMAFVFVDHNKMLTSEDIAPILGIIREDHVFELFTLLRGKQSSKAQLFLEHLLERGEKPIAVTGILSRYARDMISNNKKNGVESLSLCAAADSILKSRRVHETALLGSIVDILTE